MTRCRRRGLARMAGALGLALLLGVAPASAQEDTTPPTLERGEIDGGTLTLTFSEPLDEDWIPGPSFRMNLEYRLCSGDRSTCAADFPDGAHPGYGLPGFPNTCWSEFTASGGVTISGNTVTVGLGGKQAFSGRCAQLYYNPDRLSPTTKRLRDLAGNELGTIDPTFLTNHTAPSAWGATVNRAALTLTFENALDASAKPAASAFTVQVANQARSVTGVAMDGYTLTLTLASAVGVGQAVRVRYDQPASGPTLQDRSGNVVQSFGFKSANNVTDTHPPWLWDLTANGTTLTLTYNEALNPHSRPATGDFTVTVAGSSRAVSTVTVSGDTVTLTLASAVSAGDTVRLSYTAGSNPIRDPAGNEAASFTDRRAYNSTSPPPDNGDGGGGNPGSGGNQGGGSGSRRPRDDHGNSASRATRIPPSERTAGQLHTRSDVDYFTLTASHAGVFVVETSGATDTRGTVWQAGTEIATADSGGAGQNFRLSVQVEAGEVVIAVRGNGRQTGHYTLQTALVTGSLENPAPAAFQSGLGVISGWVCEAEAVTIEIETAHGEVVELAAAYGTERADTAAVCGDIGNGFGLLFNWNLLGEGEHAVVVLVDGIELGRAAVTVTTLGEEFMRGAAAECVVADFPSVGETVALTWQESSQNFVLAGSQTPTGSNRAGTPGVGVLENPGPNSFQSGLGVISGWVCEAEAVTLEITPADGEVVELAAAYGTERADTVGACGDTDNGFGLLFNWNLLGDGEHEVVALADGEEVGRAVVRVTTLGEEFVRGAAGACEVADFPMPGETVTLEWQESQQNFVMTDRQER